MRLAAVVFAMVAVTALQPVLLPTTAPTNATVGDPGAECTPCVTWGQMKSCYTNNPDPCCACKKFMERSY